MTGSFDSRALVDTNVLVYAMNQDDEHHEASRALQLRGLSREIDLCLAPQVLFEYFAVVTHPGLLPIPLASADAADDIERLAAALPMIFPPVDLHGRVAQLLRETGFSGRHVFDLCLVATMLANGVTNIYTYDTRFSRIPGVIALTP
jgi:predicted nucleic acid-binding protein